MGYCPDKFDAQPVEMDPPDACSQAMVSSRSRAAGARPAQQPRIAATLSPMASEAVRPGDSMPNRFTRPGRP